MASLSSTICYFSRCGVLFLFMLLHQILSHGQASAWCREGFIQRDSSSTVLSCCQPAAESTPREEEEPKLLSTLSMHRRLQVASNNRRVLEELTPMNLLLSIRGPFSTSGKPAT